MRIREMGAVLLLLLLAGCAGIGAAPAEEADEGQLSIAALFRTENGAALHGSAACFSAQASDCLYQVDSSGMVSASGLPRNGEVKLTLWNPRQEVRGAMTLCIDRGAVIDAMTSEDGVGHITIRDDTSEVALMFVLTEDGALQCALWLTGTASPGADCGAGRGSFMRILVADDEPEMTMVLQALLKREHYSVDVVYDGQDALDYGLVENYDCIILDIMMPKLNGIQVLRALRDKHVAVPVLLLTAKSQVEDRVAGLDSGADDYLPKPFDNREFISRVRALTRRGGEYTPNILTAGNVSLDCSAFELKCGSSCIRLGSKEFQMLEMLMRQTGRLISTEQFMERIWGYDSQAEINVVWAYISYLRRKLEAVGGNIRITARRGQGYLLEEMV